MTLPGHMQEPRTTQDFSEIRARISARLGQATANAPEALREISAAHLATEGKRLRGEMAFQAATLFGAHCDRAITWAAAVELIHSASLVHDDVCDRDIERRGQETVFSLYGEALAVCLGDYYIATAVRMSALLSDKTALQLCDCVARSTGGQALEFTMAGYPSWSRYCEIAVEKTSPLLSLPVTGAAGLTNYSVDRKSVEAYFANAATCFQIINDLDNFFASQGPADPCSDLVLCRPNAVISSFRDSLQSPLKSRFDRWSEQTRTAGRSREPAGILEWWQNVRQSPALSHTAQRLHFHFNTASSELNRLPPEVQCVLLKLHRWLGSELAKVNASTSIRKELNS